MASLTPTKAQLGRLSTTFTCVTTADPADVVSNANLLAMCERGPLYDMINRTYANTAAMIVSMAAQGTELKVLSNNPNPPANFGLDGSNRPALVLTSPVAGSTCAIRISLAYTSTR